MGAAPVGEIWRRIAHTSSARIYSLLLGMVSLALTARWLGPDGRGTVAAVTTWVSLFTTFGYLSLGQVAIYRAAQSPGEEWLPATFGSLAFMLVAITGLGWALAAILYFISDGAIFHGLAGLFLLIGFLGLPLMLWEHYGGSLLMALERLDISNRYQVIGKTVGVAALFVFILGWGWGIAGALLAILLGNLVQALGGLRYLLGRVGRPSLDWRELLELVKGGVKLHLNAIGTFLFAGSDVLMLNHYAGAAPTGFYQLAFQLVAVLLVVPHAASMVIYGKISLLGPDRGWGYQRKVVAGVMLLMAVGVGVSYLLAPWAIPLFAGQDFQPSVTLFQWLLLGALGMSLTQMISPQWIGRGLFIQAALLTLFVGGANVVANYFLIPAYGALGAVWASLGVYVVSILGNGLMAIYCEMKFRATNDDVQ